MSKTTSFVVALGAFGALAYLLNPLPPDAPSANRVAANSVATAGQATALPATAAIQPASAESQGANAAQATTPDVTVRLVQQIQTELLRLGCYAGAVDGRWTLETQQAMHALGERVRVLRPVQTPDYIMLALARSQASHVCTARDRATAAARLPAEVVPMAAQLDRRQEPPRVRETQRPTRRAQATRDTRRPENRPVAWEVRSSERSVAEVERDEPAGPREPYAAGESRMALGAPQVDPLRAGIDPRDPSAPAILRGPTPPSPQAAPGTNVVAFDPPVSRRIEREERRATAPTRPRRDWKRNVFIQLRESGP